MTQNLMNNEEAQMNYDNRISDCQIISNMGKNNTYFFNNEKTNIFGMSFITSICNVKIWILGEKVKNIP